MQTFKFTQELHDNNFWMHFLFKITEHILFLLNLSYHYHHFCGFIFLVSPNQSSPKYKRNTELLKEITNFN